jgi:predicted dehydrogenase
MTADTGSGGPAADGQTLRWGVVATGRIAHRVTRDLARLEGAELYAVSSRSEGSARAFAE